MSRHANTTALTFDVVSGDFELVFVSVFVFLRELELLLVVGDFGAFALATFSAELRRCRPHAVLLLAVR